ncbi:MAG: aminotransferase class [Gammaproteobacteria bacterium]|nr:aminotransferase class [Gammaproteobacteria bacterium]
MSRSFNTQTPEHPGPDSYAIRVDARRFETWESYIAGRLGLSTAIDYALGWGLDAIRRRVEHLAASLRERLDAIPGIRIWSA